MYKKVHPRGGDRQTPFLDTHIHRRHNGSVKVKVYRKKTHTNQYLAFDSHHPLHQKISVIRTLMNRCEEIVTEAAEVGTVPSPPYSDPSTAKVGQKTSNFSY